jgi:virulence-associated protein VapD
MNKFIFDDLTLTKSEISFASDLDNVATLRRSKLANLSFDANHEEQHATRQEYDEIRTLLISRTKITSGSVCVQYNQAIRIDKYRDAAIRFLVLQLIVRRVRVFELSLSVSSTTSKRCNFSCA